MRESRETEEINQKMEESSVNNEQRDNKNKFQNKKKIEE